MGILFNCEAIKFPKLSKISCSPTLHNLSMAASMDFSEGMFSLEVFLFFLICGGCDGVSSALEGVSIYRAVSGPGVAFTRQTSVFSCDSSAIAPSACN